MLTKYAIVRGTEVSIVSVDVDVGREDATAAELRDMNRAPDCVRIIDDAHETRLRNDERAASAAEELGAMTAAQQKKLLAVIARKLGIRVRP